MNKSLREWVAMLLRCKTPESFKNVLEGFSLQSWTLEERAVVSAVYTPPLAKLVRDSEDKWKWIEDLSALCWDRR